MVEIIPRARWFASYPAGFGPAGPASELWLHHSVTRSAGVAATLGADILTVQQLERVGHGRFGGGISYSYCVCMSGRVFEGTGPLRKGSHTKGRNTIACAICLVGDCSVNPPSDAAIASTAELVAHGRAQGWWSTDRLSGGHRDAPGAQTACPGDAAYACIPSINRRALNGRSADMTLTGEQAIQLAVIYDEVTKRLANRRGPGGKAIEGGGSDTVLGYVANADGFGFRAQHDLHSLILAVGQVNQRLVDIADRLARLEDKP